MNICIICGEETENKHICDRHSSKSLRLLFVEEEVASFVRYSSVFTDFNLRWASENVLRAELRGYDSTKTIQTLDINVAKMTLRVRSGKFYTTAYRRLYEKCFDLSSWQVAVTNHISKDGGRIIGVTYSWKR